VAQRMHRIFEIQRESSNFIQKVVRGWRDGH